MRPFRFCPSCGNAIDPPRSDDGSDCRGCGRTWYRTPAPAASAVIVRGGRVLLAVRGVEPEKGRIDAPGGFVHPGEELLDGLRREVREELGVEIAVDEAGFLGAAAHTYGDEEDPLLSFGFLATIVDGDPRPADDVAEIRWAGLDELDGLDFAWEHNREQARKGLIRVAAQEEERI